MSLISVDACLCGLFSLIFVSWLRSRQRKDQNNSRRLPYPPGPKRLPFLGNVLQMSSSAELWLKLKQWSETYGDLIYVENFGVPMIFVNSYEVSNDLEKRGSIYSSRPTIEMSKLEKWDWLILLYPYGEKWRKYREVLHPFFTASAVLRHSAVQERFAHKMLSAIIEQPREHLKHIRHMVGSVLILTLYGHEVGGENDYYINVAQRGVYHLSTSAGFFMVNFLPILKYVPEWFPGAGFQRIAREGREASYAALTEPYKMSKSKYLSGTAEPCMVASLLEQGPSSDDPEYAEYEHMVAACAATSFLGGADTTVGALHTFILAMVIHPDVQIQAREELDRVLGKGVLPTYADRKKLPYINAVIKESLRWEIVLPLGFPRSSTQDDYYKGYFIPKGTQVFVNQWAISRDEGTFPEPQKFMPERWILADNAKSSLPLDPLKFVFGGGRRICPGVAFADSSFFIIISSILTTFEIRKARTADGKEIEPELIFDTGLIRHPKHVPCEFVLRSEGIGRAIRQAVDLDTRD